MLTKRYNTVVDAKDLKILNLDFRLNSVRVANLRLKFIRIYKREKDRK